jgi:hypothetical protein
LFLGSRSAEYGQLLFYSTAGALGAGNFFPAREHNGFETMIAAAAVVFIDRQEIAAINA